MSKKKNTSTSANANPQALKIGSRVRCTDDGVTGRIVWTNGVSVKIKWDDGEQVTWKRDSLATRPIEILDADGDDQTTAPAVTDAAEGIPTATEAEQPAAPADVAAAAPTATTKQVPEVEATTATPEQSHAEPATLPTEPTATEPATTPTDQPATEPAAVPEATVEQVTPSSDAEAAPAAAKPKRLVFAGQCPVFPDLSAAEQVLGKLLPVDPLFAPVGDRRDRL
jgi:hypothetical protein